MARYDTSLSVLTNFGGQSMHLVIQALLELLVVIIACGDPLRVYGNAHAAAVPHVAPSGTWIDWSISDLSGIVMPFTKSL